VRLALERLDAQGLVVELPGTKQERIAIRSATRLRGVLVTGDAGAGAGAGAGANAGAGAGGDRLELSETTAETLVLEALRVVLDDLVLSNAGGATFQGLSVSLVQERASLALEVASRSLVCADLGIAVAVNDVVLAFGLKLTDARLSVRDAEGTLSAAGVELSDFSLRVGDLQLASPAVTGRDVAIRWGAKGFALDAASLDAAALEVSSGDARIALGGVHIDALALDGPTIAMGRVTVERGRVAATIAPPPPGTASETTARDAGAGGARFFDWRALDGLSGEIDVDVEVDLTVPLIGHRKATHRFRVPIAGGSLDYRALESNLAALENALIDFAVKDGVLRLERVNPLFPARGHGKPIVIWDLDAADLALAEQERVRLAVLPNARMADAGAGGAGTGAADSHEPEEPSKKSSIALRRLALHRIDVKLALAPVDGALAGQFRPRRIGSLVLQGSVDHAPDDAGGGAGGAQRPGSVLGELAGLMASVVGLPLGKSVLDASTVGLASASPIEVSFVDIHPVKVEAVLARMVADGIRLSPAQTALEP
jgi:hypothetical protein